MQRTVGIDKSGQRKASHLKIVHFYEEEKGGVPSELESNAKSESVVMPFSEFKWGSTHL